MDEGAVTRVMSSATALLRFAVLGVVLVHIFDKGFNERRDRWEIADVART